MYQLISRLQQFGRSERGQALVEYTLILGLVALVTVTVLGSVGQSLLGPLTTVANAF